MFMPCVLDGQEVSKITAYLVAFGPDEPQRLTANRDIAYSGVNPNGKGFVLSENEMKFLVTEDSRNAERIFSYLGSGEMNKTPTARSSRFIICFHDCDEPEVRAYPHLYQRLHDTVRLQRLGSGKKRLREKWWIFSRPATDLTKELQSRESVLVSGRVATHHTFTLQPTSTVFSDAATVFLLGDLANFALLQSRVHELWAGLQGSSFKDDPRYIPEDCFETFPFPDCSGQSCTLEAAGKAYYEFRATLMVENDEGLTTTYNRFHDPDDPDPGIVKLRELHAAIDRAVLDAYGWSDIPVECQFLLDYEIDEEEWGTKKKPYRYRWPEAVHDEVLARLLDLNQKRYQEEVVAGLHAEKGKKRSAPKNKTQRKSAQASSNVTLPLFEASIEPSE